MIVRHVALSGWIGPLLRVDCDFVLSFLFSGRFSFNISLLLSNFLISQNLNVTGMNCRNLIWSLNHKLRWVCYCLLFEYIFGNYFLNIST